MNSRTRVLLFLTVLCVIGVGVFTAYNQFPPDQSPALSQTQGEEEGARSDEGEQGAEPAEEPATPPTTAELSERILPSLAPAWLWVDMEQWNRHGQAFDEWLNDPAVHPVMQQVASALPQAVSETMNAVSPRAKDLRFFMLPPDDDARELQWLATFTHPQPLGDAAIATLVPAEGASSTISAGPFEILGIDSPAYSLAVLEDQGLVWVTNAPDSFTRLLTNPRRSEETNAHASQEALRERYPEAVGILHLNTAAQRSSTLWVNTLMGTAGISHAAAVLHCPDDRGMIALLGQSETASAWVDDWTPLENPLFTSIDPAGMLEFGMRWVRFTSDGIASQSPETAPDDETTPRSRDNARGERDLPPVQPRDDNDPADAQRTETNRQREPRTETNDSSMQMPPGMRMGTGRPGGMGRNRDGASRDFRERFRQGSFFNIANMIPPGEPLGINVFGTQSGKPAVAIRIADYALAESPIDRLSRIPWVNTEEVLFNNIPGQVFTFRDTPMAAGFGLDQLVAIERDGNLYLFDSTAAAELYFSFERDEATETTREQIRQQFEPSHVYGTVQTDFLKRILELEENRLTPGSQAAEEYKNLRNSVTERLSPLVYRGGYRDQEWYLELSSDSAFAVMAGGLISTWGTWTWLQPD